MKDKCGSESPGFAETFDPEKVYLYSYAGSIQLPRKNPQLEVHTIMRQTIKNPNVRQCFLLAVVLIGSLGFTQAATAQEIDNQSRTRFLTWTYQDAGAYLLDTGRNLPLLAGGGAALMLARNQIDTRLLTGVQNGYHGGGTLSSFLNVTNELGGPRVIGPVAGLFAISLATNNSKFQDAAFTSLQSLMYAGIMSYGIKHIAGRHRPYENLGPNVFVPFSGNTSFPSGHTAAAFAIITPWVYYYPGPITYGLFALSTGTALARIARDKHWPTDVLAGATLGFLTGRFLAKRHMAAISVGNVQITPTVGPQSFSVVAKF